MQDGYASKRRILGLGAHMGRGAVVVVVAEPSRRLQRAKHEIWEHGANSLGTEATRLGFSMDKISIIPIGEKQRGLDECFLSSGEGGVSLGQGALRTLVYCTTIIALSMGLVFIF